MIIIPQIAITGNETSFKFLSDSREIFQNMMMSTAAPTYLTLEGLVLQDAPRLDEHLSGEEEKV
jgi:hypothetical protein